MDKLYERINWENEPSVSSPINATNLNKIDYAVDELDNRVISLDTTKISKAETASDIVGVSLDEDTGIFTFTRRDGSTIQFDTKLEKVAVNWTYDSETEKLVLTLDDGTTQEVDLSKLITVYEFLDSDTIAFSINSAGKVVAIVKNGAITEEHLAFDYLGEIKVESAKAETASASASVSAQEAKQYRDEAKTFRDEAEQFAPDGYDELKQQVAENSARIDAVIELSAFQIQNSASGENLHLTDSADSKAVSFNLYGKAEQKQYSGKNLLQITAKSQTVNGVTFTVNEDKSVTANGTATSVASIVLNNKVVLDNSVIISGCPDGGSTTTYRITCDKYIGDKYVDTVTDIGNGVTITPEEADYILVNIYIKNGINVSNLKFYPMIRLASITDSTYEPYVGGIASPNPDYPQDITVSGSDGSVEVKSVGKNLFENTATTQTVNGVTFTVNEDKSITVNGTASALAYINVGRFGFKEDTKVILNGCPNGGSATNFNLYAYGTSFLGRDVGSGVEIATEHEADIRIMVGSGITVNNLVFKPMISIDGGEYQPYTETVSTIPTPNGLAGIKVSSGGNYTDENGKQWICDEVVKYADGSGKRIQRIGKDVFDGSDDEAWLSGTTGTSGKYRMLTRLLKGLIKTPPNNNTAFIGLSTIGKLIPAGGKGTYDCVNGVSVNSSGTEFHVYSDSYNTSDVSLWTSYLAENPMTLYYALATPIITDLSAEEIAEIEKLYTFYPVTNISNDADCGMSITYMADAKNYIDNRLALIESAMLNNI